LPKRATRAIRLVYRACLPFTSSFHSCTQCSQSLTIGIFVLMRLDSPSFVIRQYTEVSHDDTLVKSSYDLTVNAPVNAPVNAVQYVNPSFYPPPHTPLHPYTPRNTHAYRQHQQRYQ